jgi:uncharacterized membrane-anchored protein
MTLYELMGMMSAIAGLTFAYCAGEKSGGVGLWVGLVVGLFVAAFTFLGSIKFAMRYSQRTPVDTSRRRTFREELPYIVISFVAWLTIFISTFIASFLTRLVINHVAA